MPTPPEKIKLHNDVVTPEEFNAWLTEALRAWAAENSPTAVDPATKRPITAEARVAEAAVHLLYVPDTLLTEKLTDQGDEAFSLLLSTIRTELRRIDEQSAKKAQETQQQSHNFPW